KGNLPVNTLQPRPDNTAIKLVVVHGISLPPREYGGGHIQHFFCNRLDPDLHPYFETIHEMRVSAHALIERSGNLIQFVSFKDRAWHAGQSEWCGESACNDFSVGIELEGCDDEAYTPQQYESLSRLIRALRRNFVCIGEESLVGHSDIAPGRKTDPGPAFDWGYLRSLM
ncbi:MAG: 1,6-anhydro-N-acetylmuramyl-L-alanine amidase AmpD, partial [Pseudomonadota bacterium]